MRKFISIFSLLTLLYACGSVSVEDTDSQVPQHDLFDELLKKYVDEKGFVDYKGLAKDRGKLQTYLNLLQSNGPNGEWSEEEQLAYWINAYNAFTLELILEHYPVESIKDIGSLIKIPFVNTPWDIKFIKIGGKELDLNNIEHGIIRKQFNEPRIHFALVCAAESCPRLLNEAYVPEKLDAQLTRNTKAFLSNTAKNEFLNADEAEVSKLFSWYRGDFTKGQTVIEFINRYAPATLNVSAKLKYKNYSWKLNEQ